MRTPQFQAVRRVTISFSIDLDSGLEGRLLVSLGVAKAVIGIAARDDLHANAPVPGGAEGDDLLLDRGRVERTTAAPGPGPAVHVALEVGQRELADREALAE